MDISKIKGQNKSVIKMKIYYNDFKLFNLQEKFPNTEDLYIDCCTKERISTFLLIKENPNCKINTFEINMEQEQIIKAYCGPYEKLESIKFYFSVQINLKNSFPIFNDYCQILFKSLLIFKLDTNINNSYFCLIINFNIINNIVNNIEKMPNLREFQLTCKSDKDIPKNFYIKFIKKILNLESIKKIKIEIPNKCIVENEIYSRKDIIEMFPEINVHKIYGLYELKINKYFCKINKKDIIEAQIEEEEEIYKEKSKEIKEENKEISEIKEIKEETAKTNNDLMNNICVLI